MSSGRTLWDEFCFRFHRGAIWVKDASWQWGALKNEIDPERYADVALKWQVQLALARHWRDSGIFFKSCSGLLLSKECLETGGSPTGWAGF